MQETEEYTVDQLVKIDEEGKCPECGEGLDTGMGFGKRDLECGDSCTGEAWTGTDGVEIEGCECGGHEDAHCGWSASYPAEIYAERVLGI